MAQAQSHQTIAGVADQRNAGITDQRNLRALLHGQHQLGSASQLIVFVIADQRFLDAVMVQQLLRVAGIFAGDLIDFLQNTQRAQGDVFQIADRCSDQV